MSHLLFKNSRFYYFNSKSDSSMSHSLKKLRNFCCFWNKDESSIILYFEKFDENEKLAWNRFFGLNLSGFRINERGTFMFGYWSVVVDFTIFDLKKSRSKVIECIFNLKKHAKTTLREIDGRLIHGKCVIF
jgi:hypothetical protein